MLANGLSRYTYRVVLKYAVVNGERREQKKGPRSRAFLVEL